MLLCKRHDVHPPKFACPILSDDFSFVPRFLAPPRANRAHQAGGVGGQLGAPQNDDDAEEVLGHGRHRALEFENRYVFDSFLKFVSGTVARSVPLVTPVVLFQPQFSQHRHSQFLMEEGFAARSDF